MNQTEHQLRMSFDPEYEAKWLKLKEDRKDVRRVTVKMMRSRGLFALLFWCGAMVYVLSRSWPAAFIVPVVLWIVERGLYMWLSDRRKRKELGL